jgi:tRNA A-37 threonylcarbamoyl transferase component Bud32
MSSPSSASAVDGPNPRQTSAPVSLVDLPRQPGQTASLLGPIPPPARRCETFDFLAPPEEADEVGRLGGYRLLQLLGTGGMGMVFVAEDVSLKRKVALKVMLPMLAVRESSRRRFVREAQAAAAIQHDHIVTIHQVGEDRGVPFLAMQLLKGESLEERLQREPRPRIAEVLRIGHEIAQGLAAAHDQGLMHRDIKPANIWLESDTKRVKILDFGLARAVDANAQLTQDGTIVGTPAFMAPEQARNLALDGRCDLFSLGCVLYLMCTGRHPFQGNDTIAMLLSVAMEQPVAPGAIRPDVPAAFSELIMRLLAKDPADRPASALMVIQALEAIEHEYRQGPPRALAVTPPLATPAFLPLGAEFAEAADQARRPGRLRTKNPYHRAWWLVSAGIVLVSVGLLPLIGNGKREAGSEELEAKAPGAAHPAPRVQVHLQPEPLAAVRPDVRSQAHSSLAPDRQAAQWVLGLGGKVTIRGGQAGQTMDITALADLPAGPFRLQRIHLAGNKQVTDAGMENLKGLTRLETLWLADTPISNLGLACLTDVTGLQGLNLGHTGISDAGLEHLRGLTDLRFLYLSGTKVTDAGLKCLKDHLQLQELHLRWTKVSDAGLEHLAGLSNLQILWLQETKVSDAGLGHLKRLTGLQTLHLDGTKVSDAGINELRAALPGCRIVPTVLSANAERKH